MPWQKRECHYGPLTVVEYRKACVPGAQIPNWFCHCPGAIRNYVYFELFVEELRPPIKLILWMAENYIQEDGYFWFYLLNGYVEFLTYPGISWGLPDESGQGLAAKDCPTHPSQEHGRPGGLGQPQPLGFGHLPEEGARAGCRSVGKRFRSRQAATWWRPLLKLGSVAEPWPGAAAGAGGPAGFSPDCYQVSGLMEAIHMEMYIQVYLCIFHVTTNHICV